MYYSAIGLLAILVLLIENHDLLFNTKDIFDKPSWKVYRRFLFAVLVYYVVDVLWGLFEAKKLTLLLFADTTVYFVAMAVGVSFWSQFTVVYLEGKDEQGQMLVMAGRIVAGAIALLAVVNIFKPVLFTVDAQCVYRELPVRHIVLVSQILLLLLISVYGLYCLRSNPTKGKTRYYSLMLFGLIMAVFLFGQLWFAYFPLYSIAYMLATCLVHTFVVNDENEEYRRDLEQADKIKQMKDTIVSLMDNMPAMTFTKDAETGAYLACNQAFASYANKKDPSGVIGLTARQIFGDETAKQFDDEDRIAYARIHALAGDFICVYVVDPETGRYREISAVQNYTSFEQAKEGMDFFKTTREAARQFNHPDDLNRFLSIFTLENVMAEIKRRGIFTLSYRLMMDGQPLYVLLKAAMVEEKEGNRLIVGIVDIDNQVRQEEAYVQNLAKPQINANIDPLTHVKNRHAYLEAEERLNNQIAEGRETEFAIVILDVNDLKRINDTAGHNAGDQYIQDACKIICNTFKHSPVFRIGGDEFAVISQGSDYSHIDGLVGHMRERNAEAKRNGGIVIACGMAKYENDARVGSVFERADQNMYDNKTTLKTQKAD